MELYEVGIKKPWHAVWLPSGMVAVSAADPSTGYGCLAATARNMAVTTIAKQANFIIQRTNVKDFRTPVRLLM